MSSVVILPQRPYIPFSSPLNSPISTQYDMIPDYKDVFPCFQLEGHQGLITGKWENSHQIANC